MPIPMKRASVFCEGLDHPECLAVHPDGSIWAGGEAGQIYRISDDGTNLEEITSTGGFILGVAFDPGGKKLTICDLRQRRLFQYELKSHTLTEFASSVGGEPMSIPNHLVYDRRGMLYVTDSGAFRKTTGRIYRFDPDGRGEVWHAGPFNFANGIAISPKGDAIYVVCSFLPGIERIEILPNGSPGKRSVFARLPKTVPDGLAFDKRGNLYVSCYAPARIYKITPQRKVSILLDDWEAHTISNCTNIAFGGGKMDQLFVANLGRWHITKIDLRVAGAPLASHAGA